jgi:SAM-dependent methyltransferase
MDSVQNDQQSSCVPPDDFDQLAMIQRLPKAHVVDRIAYLVELAAGRRVIHIGFADAGCRTMQDGAGTWLHAHLAQSAACLVGLDIDPAGVESARAAGYDAHLVDCRDPDAVAALDVEPADLIVAGEVIEHLDAPGPFLDAVRNLARPGTDVVLTTPNTSGVGSTLAALAGLEINHPDHVTGFTCRTLMALLDRHGWSSVAVRTYVPKVKAPADRSRRARALYVAGVVVERFERGVGRLGRPFLADGLIVVGRLREP